MNSFEGEYNHSRLYVPDCTSIFEVNVYRNSRDLDYICFVEGPTDPEFYNNILNTAISGKNLKFIRSLTSRETKYGSEIGKEGVIKNYFSIYQYPEFKDILNKSLFIVDHDYEGLLSEYYEQDEINSDVFTQTPYYAFENFFLTNENIEKIFKYFKLSDEEIIKFKNLVNQFVEENSNYTRLKSSVTIACKKCKYNEYLRPSKIYIPYGAREGEFMTPDDIFHFKFDRYGYDFYNRDFMLRQNKAMYNSIKNSSKIMNYYNNETQKFINNRNFVRGHDIFKLLEQYLKQKFNINISQSIYDSNSEYKNIIKLLDVKMDFINGLGEIIK